MRFAMEARVQEHIPTDHSNSRVERMLQMINGYWVSQIVRAAATFSIAEELAGGPATAAEIAKRQGVGEDAMFRLLRACAALGLVATKNGFLFSGTPLLETLGRDTPVSLRALAIALGAPGHWLPWGNLPEAMRTGQRQTTDTLGAELWEYFAKEPHEAKEFTLAMTNLTAPIARDAACVIDTQSTVVAADIGGAGGALIRALMEANPKLKGILFDRPEVVQDVAKTFDQPGLKHRFSVVGGDFFESVPEVDLYLLKHVLHDWDDASCIRILENCRRAMRPGGRVNVIELEVDEIGQSGLAPLMDINMMVLTNGRERTPQQYRKLFESAGMHMTRVTPMRSGMPMVVLEATAG
jgi:hypothetical protein